MDRDEAELSGSGVREAVGLARRADHDVPLLDGDGLVADAEGRLAGLDDEDLGVGMAMELWADAWLGMDEDDREGHVTVVGPDQLVGVAGVLEIVERDDDAGLERHDLTARRFARLPIRDLHS